MVRLFLRFQQHQSKGLTQKAPDEAAPVPYPAEWHPMWRRLR
jgi:hypothetical protein